MITIPLYAQDDTPTPYEIALQRIEAARESNATQLDLSNLGLTELPPEIGHLSSLQALSMFDNQLTILPPEIGQLSNLRALYVVRNRLSALPPEIGQLSELCLLDLRDNNLRYLPPTISNLNFLEQNEPCPFATVVPTANQLSYKLFLYGNPLISPPPEVVEQGTAAVLSYLRNQAWYHTQRLIIGAAGGIGLFALLVLCFRWKQRDGRKLKQKRG